MLFLMTIGCYSFAQDTSSRRADTLVKKTDRLTPYTSDSTLNATSNDGNAGRPVNTAFGKRGDDYSSVLRQQPYFNFFGRPRYQIAIKEERHTEKDILFYLLLGLVCYFALVKLFFSKYFSNLFAVFFQVSLKQKQIREQLLQSPLPSLLMNIFFVVCGGLYTSFLLYHYQLTTFNFWTITLYGILALSIIYLVKFLVLKLMGWIFDIREATDTYIFVVFLVNKLIGVLLIPFLILLAFSSKAVVQVLVTVSLTIISILLAYRYLFSYSPVRREIKVSQFHFFLYLCGFELAPLLLIYKVLFKFLETSS